LGPPDVRSIKDQHIGAHQQNGADLIGRGFVFRSSSNIPLGPCVHRPQAGGPSSLSSAIMRYGDVHGVASVIHTFLTAARSRGSTFFSNTDFFLANRICATRIDARQRRRSGGFHFGDARVHVGETRAKWIAHGIGPINTVKPHIRHVSTPLPATFSRRRGGARQSLAFGIKAESRMPSGWIRHAARS